MRLSGVGHLAHLVALAAAPRTRRDGVRRVARGPITKSIVMLGDEHEQIAAEILRCAEPLVRVERRGIEQRRFFTPRAPLDFIERVHAEVEEERPLESHPRGLIRARQHLRRLLGDDGGGVTFVNHLLRCIRDRIGILVRGVRGRLTLSTSQTQQKHSRQRNALARVV